MKENKRQEQIDYLKRCKQILLWYKHNYLKAKEDEQKANQYTRTKEKVKVYSLYR